jgi:hypothetical protein
LRIRLRRFLMSDPMRVSTLSAHRTDQKSGWAR